MTNAFQNDSHPLVNFVLRATRDVPFPKFHAGSSAKRGSARVLDAIASVCVSKAQGQAVATSLTLPNEKEILICVAQNNHDLVSDETVAFLKKLWELLRELSAYNKKDRGANNGLPSEGESPQPMCTGEIEETSRNIKILCYKQGIRKLKQRVQKYWEDFSRLCELWKYNPTGPEALRVEFRQTSDNLSLVKDLLTLDEPDFLQLTQLIGSSRRCFDKLSHGRYLWTCMKNYTQETVPTKESFDLSHYLKKVFSLDRSILKLYGFALSRHMHVFEQRELTIQWVSPELRKIEIPLTKDEWTEYILQVFGAAGIEDRTLSKSTVEEEVQLALETQMENPAPVHCECILLAHHHQQLNVAPKTQGETVIPPHRYIGCSKEACYACVQYFEAYNTPSDIKKYSTNFCIRGSPPKLCDSWSMPFLHDRDADSCVREEFHRLLCEDYADYMLALKRVERSLIHGLSTAKKQLGFQNTKEHHPTVKAGESKWEITAVLKTIPPSQSNGSGAGSSTVKPSVCDNTTISDDPRCSASCVADHGFIRTHSDGMHQRGNTNPFDKTMTREESDTKEKMGGCIQILSNLENNQLD